MHYTTDTAPTILIVDDERAARRTVEMLLLKEGYTLLFVASGAEALAMLEEIEPDTILMDVMMPGMDGFELCQRIKSSEYWRHIPLILTTALDSKEDLARGLEAGADDFVSKPINGLELRARVRSMLRIKRRHDALQRLMQLRADLSSMIMHDIRSPLAALEVYCDLLEPQLSSASGCEYLQAIRQESNRLSSFVTDMLMTTKMEEERLVLDPKETDVNALLRSVCRSYEQLANSRDIRFRLNLPARSARVFVDVALCKRLFDNLLSNAFKFSPPGGNVVLSVAYSDRHNSRSGSTLRISLTDEGPGIPREFHETIFDRYEIVARGRREVTQVGLGLAFCKLVVDAHGGRISVSDNEPHGAVFTVEL